jgi:hypothetical protein
MVERTRVKNGSIGLGEIQEDGTSFSLLVFFLRRTAGRAVFACSSLVSAVLRALTKDF